MIWLRLRNLAPGNFFYVLVNDEILRLPRRLRGHIGVDHGLRRGTYFEEPAMRALRRVIHPGDCVFDIGCSFGILTCLIARIVGPHGSVHAFEANPQVLNWARRIAALNLPKAEIRFVHACIAETSGAELEFYTVPAQGSVASTRNIEILQFHPDAGCVRVPSLSIGDYCRQTGVIPHCLKIDVEGSECLALQGAYPLLEQYHPHLIIETHGLEIEGIGGNLSTLCDTLLQLRYDLWDLLSDQQITAEEYSSLYTRRIGYLLATYSRAEKVR